MANSLVGERAPELSLPDSNGEPYTLSPGAKGVPTALFFYPKSGSYGCTREVCSFRDAIAENPTFKTTNVEVIGVSSDSVEIQKAFVEKQKLTYPVLSDEKGDGKKAYGVGRGILGLTDARVTFVIDGKGVVRDVLDTTLNFAAHSKFVAKWLEKLEAEAKPDVASVETPEHPVDDKTSAQETPIQGVEGA